MKKTRIELETEDRMNFIIQHKNSMFDEIFKSIVTKNEYKSSNSENLMHDVFLEQYGNHNISKLVSMRDLLSTFLIHYKDSETKIGNYLQRIELEIQKRE
jgi:hypothetical protein